MKKALLLISHGSRSPLARKEALALAARLKRLSGFPIARAAFLEINKPSIAEGAAACVRDGASEVLVLQNFLNSGNHVLKDIPAILKEVSAKHPGVRFEVLPFIGSHPQIPELFLDLISKFQGGRRCDS